ncbi:centromere protein N [Gouania willdenowi]|uniref:Centromere protein N n=1 Tax=Gouania willdenowi TaxID=441366 RepID=A0A8C5DRV0_GOUWI|nr:centromere protein N [Gouania willdenowi]
MNDPGKCLLKRVIRRIPANMLKTTLSHWGRVSDAQLQSVDFTTSKWALTEKLLNICEENELTVKHVTELEMIHVIDYPNLGMWYAFQLFDPDDAAPSVDMTQFKEQFKFHLSKLMRNVSVKIKKHTDEAIWIRVAWGDGFSRPNHMKPTYVVHHLQSSYVFVTRLTSKLKPLLSQALVLSTRYQGIKDANLSGRNLAALRNLLMRQYQQVFSTKFSTPLAEKSENISNPQIEREQAESATKRHQMACEAFGDGVLPQLQSAVYKLETKFRDHNNKTMTDREEPFKCIVKFTSTNLLESLRHCASSGIASTPVTPLLSSVPVKGRNYFVITDNVPGSSSQTNRPQK